MFKNIVNGTVYYMKLITAGGIYGAAENGNLALVQEWLNLNLEPDLSIILQSACKNENNIKMIQLLVN